MSLLTIVLTLVVSLVVAYLATQNATLVTLHFGQTVLADIPLFFVVLLSILFGTLLASIVTMLEEQRACLDIVQQLQAVESAINSAKKALIHDHIGECLMHTIGPDNTTRQQVLEEFQAITKYL